MKKNIFCLKFMVYHTEDSLIRGKNDEQLSQNLVDGLSSCSLLTVKQCCSNYFITEMV